MLDSTFVSSLYDSNNVLPSFLASSSTHRIRDDLDMQSVWPPRRVYCLRRVRPCASDTPSAPVPWQRSLVSQNGLLVHLWLRSPGTFLDCRVSLLHFFASHWRGPWASDYAVRSMNSYWTFETRISCTRTYAALLFGGSVVLSVHNHQVESFGVMPIQSKAQHRGGLFNINPQMIPYICLKRAIVLTWKPRNKQPAVFNTSNEYQLVPLTHSNYYWQPNYQQPCA